jgi:glycosyltransferase involved in cell wall biosynthesis
MEIMVSTQKESGRTETWIALLGRKDVPADGIADYCSFLGQNLVAYGLELIPEHVEWSRDGWPQALGDLWHHSKHWRGLRVLLQYAALAWSRRGFPLGILACAAILRLRGARCAIIFHEPFGVSGPRLIDKARCAFQNWTVRILHRFAEKSIFTIPLGTVPWLSADDAESASIPIGSNIPEHLANRRASSSGATKTVVVFCVSESRYGEQEINDVAAAARTVAERGIKIRVIFVGRGTVEAKGKILDAFGGSGIEVYVRGLCEAPEISRIFSESDAMLAVRGKLYLRRGSALAGLACGLPMVAYAGSAEDTIIEEAGIALVPFHNQAALASALLEILTDSELWQEMHEKNLRFQKKYLSWSVIAASFTGFLRPR